MNTSDDLELNFEKDRYCSATLAANTLKCHGHGWKQFQKWCALRQRCSLLADPATVSLWVTALLRDGLKTSSVSAWLAGIAHFHRRAKLPCPCGPEVQSIMNGARRLRHETPQGKHALTIKQLWQVSRLMDTRTVRGARNRALIVMGFAGAFRRSELSALNIDDVFCRRGFLFT